MSLAEITRTSELRVVNDTNRYRPPLGLAQCVVPLLPLGVADIAANNQGLVEEHILGLWSDSMALPILGSVGLVPFKPGANIKRVFASGHTI